MYIKVAVKDPMATRVDAIVNPVGLFFRGNPEFVSGLGWRIFSAAGDELPEFCRTTMGDDDDERRCVISQSFRLRQFRRVINVLWDYDLGRMCAEETRYFPHVLRQAIENGCRSIVIPLGWYTGYKFDLQMLGNIDCGVLASFCKIAQAYNGIKIVIACRDALSCECVMRLVEGIEQAMKWEGAVSRPDFNFCKCGDIEDGIVRILTESIFDPRMGGVLHERYARMRGHFRDEKCCSNVWSQDEFGVCDDTYNKNGAILRVSKAKALNGNVAGILRPFYNCGCDLPVWVYGRDQHRPRVFIIGQDPQRNGLGNEEVFLATPWGCHSKAFVKCAWMRDFVARMIYVTGCDVYLTDYAKFFFARKQSYGQKEPFEPNFKKRLNLQCQALRCDMGLNDDFHPLVEILKKEVKMWKPNLILSFGCDKTIFNRAWPVVFDRNDYANVRAGVNFGGYECGYMSLYHPNAHWGERIKKYCGERERYFATAHETIRAFLKSEAAATA